MRQMRNDVKCVLISDVHFSLNTLELASTALTKALLTAQELKVPLVVAGDLHDTKALMRAECVNKIIRIFQYASPETRIIVLVGNHDLINEKGDAESHALHFLGDLVEVVQSPVYDRHLDAWLVPYFSDSDKLQAFLNTVPKGSTLIMHQGVQSAFMGEYVVDKSSLPKEAFADFRVISGHYHRAQDIKCGRPRKGAVGLFSYIGTPYSITFAEAHDGPKGIQLLLNSGLLEQVPLDLRKHFIVERTASDVMDTIPDLGSNDLLWLKVSGPASLLDKLDKKKIGMQHLGHESFKLDLIYDESEQLESEQIDKLTDEQVLDKLIDESEETIPQQTYLKSLWREVLSENT